MKLLIIINAAPYENENAYNALRMALQFQKDFTETEITIFLLADGVSCSVANQDAPHDRYDIEKMLVATMQQGAVVKLCTTCGEERGLRAKILIEKIQWSSMQELCQLVAESDKVINF